RCLSDMFSHEASSLRKDQHKGVPPRRPFDNADADAIMLGMQDIGPVRPAVHEPIEGKGNGFSRRAGVALDVLPDIEDICQTGVFKTASQVNSFGGAVAKIASHHHILSVI